jgi:hypothetical protein
MTLTLDQDQRNAMYRFAVTDLAETGEIATLLQAGKIDRAQRLRRRIEQDAWLLDELGWSATEPEENYEVEFSDEDSTTIFGRFCQAAGIIVDKSEKHPDVSEQALIDALYILRLCDGLFGRSEADAPS